LSNHRKPAAQYLRRPFKRRALSYLRLLHALHRRQLDGHLKVKRASIVAGAGVTIQVLTSWDSEFNDSNVYRVQEGNVLGH
jgi:hypothetical protein